MAAEQFIRLINPIAPYITYTGHERRRIFDIPRRWPPRGEKRRLFQTSLGTAGYSVSVSLIAYTYWLMAESWNGAVTEPLKSRTNCRETRGPMHKGNRKRSVDSPAASILVARPGIANSSLHARLPYFVCTIMPIRKPTIRAYVIIIMGMGTMRDAFGYGTMRRDQWR